MDGLRKPFFYAAALCIVMIILIEIGSGAFIRGGLSASGSVLGQLSQVAPQEGALGEALDEVFSDSGDEIEDIGDSVDDLPGLAIPYMALLDIVLLLTIGLMVSSEFIPRNYHARVQGCFTCVFGLILVLTSFALIFVAIGLVLLMIALLLSVPFGTIVYLVTYGFFNTGAAAAVLTLLMTLKIAVLVLLALAQQRFLQNRGLVLILFSTIIVNVIISFLHGFPPGILVSITDAIGAIIGAVCALIWSIFLIVGAIPAILRALNLKSLE